MKTTAAGRIYRRGNISFEHHAFSSSFNFGIGNWNSRNQSFRVRHQRIVINRFGLRYFDNLAEIHHRDATGGMADGS